MNIELYKLDKNLKRFLLSFIIILTAGVLSGLGYLYYTTSMTAEGTITRYNGSQTVVTENDFDIPTDYERPISEMLLTTHSHLISFSLIFFLIGSIFYLNTIVTGFWKYFLMIEPLVSSLTTFSSIWLMRFVSEKFVYVTIISSTLVYTSFFIMVGILIYEIIFKKVNLKPKKQLTGGNGNEKKNFELVTDDLSTCSD